MWTCWEVVGVLSTHMHALSASKCTVTHIVLLYVVTIWLTSSPSIIIIAITTIINVSVVSLRKRTDSHDASVSSSSLVRTTQTHQTFLCLPFDCLSRFSLSSQALIWLECCHCYGWYLVNLSRTEACTWYTFQHHCLTSIYIIIRTSRYSSLIFADFIGRGEKSHTVGTDVFIKSC